ncbi:tryptophan--tRNA ligase [Candidatus Daviesbacteria bacterium RIFCSPHIGHO2_01_FULL_44_29]|uniref:Tryptophan--tRNA ligase n=1 Tax=Candidatus Daviesbacteria bacterium RIFCSPHIGHO2_02_FULL_43_12 TaxID=1797776 RepID=A0A1F5KIB6_9BACT|nr:MAG: tryptophan--tRNA ligase [Candidatus Daviesbacteria bacterium RIFCSPHIGHO2_01_FULL_44_29]OGE39218.1 MAG: tryptophan--tRNA ligase [Candidatus Daviesbacteria bacterium RIFCSPHIGHO2_12_FULL_47_45]OGE40579.1 MAG: tryptophan--tRNA ligase [Candidatus Daviesbacteria bacterium RIFCSPHIGHO2_02_FULL_43_12]OGE70139.1 MAG: tryptophan--tRNA ligase [Candidatus Daviesbacteria bacterium RIFCSPLOWO2_01_FULL_43_15]
MKRILTGDRPTGKMHLGHFVGSLKNRVSLQDEYETFIMVADVQALTDNYNNPEKVRDNVLEVTMDNLAVGLDPKKVTFFIQSQIAEIAELTVLFMNLVTMEKVMRNPTVKTEIAQKFKDGSVPFGFINYPVSQSADILFLRTHLVPAGEDQRPMVELSRDIAEKFNATYKTDVFPLPDLKVGEFGRLVGTDGNAKMSKSLGNTIYLSDTPEEVEKKVMSMYTDPARIKATDPGHVEGNPVFIYLDAFAPNDQRSTINDLQTRYRGGQVGDIEVKKYLAKILNAFLAPIRARRAEYEQNPDLVREILRQGTEKTRREAVETMKLVRKAMKIDYFA